MQNNYSQKFFLYARKSTDTEEMQVLSIEAQLAELREFAKRESLTILEEFIEKQTAKIPGRPIFNEMISRIEKGEANGILSWHAFMSIPQFFYIQPVSSLVFLSV